MLDIHSLVNQNLKATTCQVVRIAVVPLSAKQALPSMTSQSTSALRIVRPIVRFQHILYALNLPSPPLRTEAGPGQRLQSVFTNSLAILCNGPNPVPLQECVTNCSFCRAKGKAFQRLPCPVTWQQLWHEVLGDIRRHLKPMQLPSEV